MALSQGTYYGRKGQQQAALIRARRPYLVKNIVTGLSLLAFTGCVYALTISKIGQDEFDDVKVPDLPAEPAKK
ncbi:uncharacterized protein MKZ38_009300 [Zalerion maritima]|uniref:Cytochrome c oxidase assembly factor 3 n=1 Tax=Zalerion maritima TaxID=339359 RepID=A0AAD5RTF7_9PEZI|nr:uncharacterized protein MKZ38_009300 [Zalerion maritima]